MKTNKKNKSNSRHNSWHCGNLKIYDGKEFTGQEGGIVVEEGIITKIGEKWKSNNSMLKESIPFIDGKGSNICPGLIDAKVQVPSINKGNIERLVKDANKGGVTSVLIHGGNQKSLDSLQQIQHCFSISKDLDLNIGIVASATIKAEGKKMTDIGLISDAGVKIFGNGLKPLPTAKDVAIWFQYAKAMSAKLWETAEEDSLTEDGLIDSGQISLQLGLKSRPRIAERILIERDTALAEAYSGNLIVGPISTAVGLEAINRAKEENQNITATTAWHYILYDNSILKNYNTLFKVYPPLRSSDNVATLRNELKSSVKKFSLYKGNGDNSGSTIDIIVSDHIKNHRDDTKQPFVEAAVGRRSLHEFLDSLLTVAKICNISWHSLLPLVTINPAKLAGLPCGRLEVGAPADLLIFDVVDNAKRENGTENSIGSIDNLSKIRHLVVSGRFVTL